MPIASEQQSAVSVRTNIRADVETRARDLVSRMNVGEKIGQMSQLTNDCHDLEHMIRNGEVGSILNEVDLQRINELQHIASHESRLGIPLLIGRDVIHGFRTIFPIPLGQAASWNTDAVKLAAKISAVEAASQGINWSFAPMIDVCRDPRWGRIAESPGEDPYLCSEMADAMVRGFQGEDLANPGSIAACAKHFAGYGASESGVDYNTTNIPENELRNVHLRPFKAAADAGVATFMSSFSDLNGIPASANSFLMRQVLREEWEYDGFVVSDWASIEQLTAHGLTGCDRDAAAAAAIAGIDMEMATTLYREHLPQLLADGVIKEADLDDMVFNILVAKLRLGLFEESHTHEGSLPPLLNNEHLEAAKELAIQSCVLLKNDDDLLPLTKNTQKSIAVIGPLADDGYEQLGTWVFDGNAEDSVSCLEAIRQHGGSELTINVAKGTDTSRSHGTDGFEQAINAARESDVACMFLGEESILTGEAHCRADIALPGAQEQLITAISELGVPIVLIVLAGRPLTIEPVLEKCQAVLYAWHPGTMGGPAIADLLFGLATPSGKLPVSFPRMVGQVPIYYGRKNTGRPPSPENITHIDDIDGGAEQTSLGMSAFHLDAGYQPLFPFGYGLSYTQYAYEHLQLSTQQIKIGDSIDVSISIRNTGARAGTEIVQLYVRDLVGSVTRPVRELKGFQRISLQPDEERRVHFQLRSDDLAFYDRDMKLSIEPGWFHLWVSNSSDGGHWAEFELIDDNDE